MHLTPTTVDRELAAQWFSQFEGAGLDGIVAKPLEVNYQQDKRVMFKVKHERTADCVVAGYRLHKSGPDAIGSLLLGLYDKAGWPASAWSAPSRWRRAARSLPSCSPSSLALRAIRGPWAERSRGPQPA